MTLRLALSMLAALAVTPAWGAEVRAQINMVGLDGVGAKVGEVVFRDASGGAAIETKLDGLPPGLHGFHVHEKGSCGVGPDKTGKVVPAGAAGGHLDPAMTAHHEGPSGHGHLGDLPALTVAPDGTAKETLTAPRITDVTALKGRTIMIHVGGDNYSDTPAPLGGGGARMACGVIG